MSNDILIFDKKKSKMVKCGHIQDDCFIKNVISKKHFIRIYSGYAVQAEALENIKKLCKYIIIKEDNNKTYKISIEDFIKNSLKWNGGHGLQYVIPVKYMRESNKEQQELF